MRTMEHADKKRHSLLHIYIFDTYFHPENSTLSNDTSALGLIFNSFQTHNVLSLQFSDKGHVLTLLRYITMHTKHNSILEINS